MTDYIHASNGDGIAATAIVTTVRGIGSTQLIVDTVLNWPHNGIALSENVDGTNKTVFRYHLDGSIITIETFAPGYSDIGNEIDQIVLLKPTAEWANEIADAINTLDTEVATATLTEISTAEIDAGTATDLRAITGRRVQYIISKIQAAVFLLAHPVGAIYTSVDSANPGTANGGTWVAWGAGRVPLAMGNNGTTNYTTVEATGGEERHTLSMLETPNHSLTLSHHGDEGGSLIRTFSTNGSGSETPNWVGAYKAPPGSTSSASSMAAPRVDWGGGGSHENRQPYITVYMWKRTA
jgi:hypothetical protein